MNKKPVTLTAAPDQISDEEVIERVIAGQTNAFELLIERHHRSVARIVWGKVPGQDAAEVAHLVFIRAFKSLPRYSPTAPFAHWLSTLAVRTCYDFWRERYRRRETPMTAFDKARQRKLMGRASEEEAGKRVENWDLLNRVLDYLSPADRMAVLLVHVEGRSTAEAAELLGWSTANVKVRCLRARRKLRLLITKELGQEEVDYEDE